jgi:HEAT repeat protein
MPLANPVAVIVLSVLFGAAVGVNFIGAESYLLSVAPPVYAVYAAALAGVAFWFFLSYLNLRHLKFAVFSLIAAAAYAATLLALTSPSIPPLARGAVWFCLAVFAHRFFRWLVAQLVLKHLDPARSQTHLSYLVATYEAGMLGALLAIKAGGAELTPNQAIYVTCAFCAAGLLLVGVQFCPERNFEIHFNRRAVDPPRIDERMFSAVLRAFGFMAFCMGAFKMSEEYLVRAVLKDELGSYEAIRDVVTNYRIAGNALIIASGLAIGALIRRKHLSPVVVLRVMLGATALVAAGAAVSRSLGGFVALEVARWVGENCLWFISSQMVISSFVDDYRGRAGRRQAFFFFVVPLAPLLVLFTAVQGLETARLRVLLLGLAGLSLAGAAVALSRFRRPLAEALYAFVESGHKAAGVLAVNLLSYLRPKNYEVELERLLARSPKKLLRKNIILSLGYSDELATLDTIIREFESDQEEIQIAVLDALRISQRHKAAQFLTRVTRADVRPKTIRVRINAAHALAAMYGKRSIPVLLQGLEDPDERIVANTLETLAEFRDRGLIPCFERFVGSPVARVRANALMGLARFARTRSAYRERIAEILNGSDRRMLASILYAIGWIRDRAFRAELRAILQSPALRDESVDRCLAWALIQTRDPAGAELFTDLLTRPAEPFMHFFSQLRRETRMDLVRHAVVTRGRDPRVLEHLEQALHSKVFDFHEELDYFYLLRNRLGLDARPAAG